MRKSDDHGATTKPPEPGAAKAASTSLAQGLASIVVTQGLRYWLLAAWALLLGLCCGPLVAAIWFCTCSAIGLVRGHIERGLARRAAPTVGAELTAIAALSSAAWAVAPILAWSRHGSWSFEATVVFLYSGGLLVATQFRHLPRKAVIVGSPYIAVALFVAANAAGTRAFWPFLAMAAVAVSALVTKVLFGSVHKAQIDAFQAEQTRLIRELETARDAADAASQAKSAFLATISHELRTPMNGVLGAAQLLERGALDSQARDLVGTIRESGGALSRLLDDVLDFASIEQGRLPIFQTQVDLRALTGQIVGMWRARASQKGLTLALNIADDVPAWVNLDSLRVSQILHNLISNAVKFTDAGAVAIAIAVALEDEGRRLRIAVQDNGPGIAQADHDRLFQAFSQIDGSSTRRHGGAGLGLAISRRIAGLLGGDLWLSPSAHGACFVLDLPLEEARPLVDAPANDPVASVETGDALDVLVVEDHPINRKIVEAWLGSMGHRCVTADDGRQGVEAARQARFDLILMDVNMPVMDGLAAVRVLRGEGVKTPIVMLSASASSTDHARGLEAGADGYLAKPLDFSALQDILEAIGARAPAVPADAASVLG